MRAICLFLAFLLTGCGIQPERVQSYSQISPKTADSPLKQYAAAWSESVRMLSLPERVLLLHDHLVRRVTFDNTAPRRHSAEGALTDRLAVCDGYADAFCLLAAAANIPSKIITGTKDGIPHAWNLVLLDGAWYHIDCTADDSDSGAPLHTRFLCRDTDMNGYVWTHSAYPAAEGGTQTYAAIVREMADRPDVEPVPH